MAAAWFTELYWQDDLGDVIARLIMIFFRCWPFPYSLQLLMQPIGTQHAGWPLTFPWRLMCPESCCQPPLAKSD